MPGTSDGGRRDLAAINGQNFPVNHTEGPWYEAHGLRVSDAVEQARGAMTGRRG